MTVTARPAGVWWRFIHYPLVRIVIGSLALVAAVAAVQIVFTFLPRQYRYAADLVSVAAIAAVSLAVYIGFVKVMERRRVVELSTQGAAQELGARNPDRGCAVFGCNRHPVAARILHRRWAQSVAGADPRLCRCCGVGVSSRSCSSEASSSASWTAGLAPGWDSILSALVFGLLHMINPGATLWAGIAVAIEAGILLAAAFVLTRRLWLAIGIHFAWNFVEGGIFGTPVSGTAPSGLFQAQLIGPVGFDRRQLRA